MINKKAKLILEDGTVFEGTAAGFKKSVAGEVVFATGMTGYDLSLTDPSYSGQILCFTYPLIGNWGVPPKDFWESEKIHVAAVVISDLTTKPNHHLMQKTLNEWLIEQTIPAIVGVDTRLLTQKLREKGVMLGKIVFDNKNIDFDDPNTRNLVAEVSPREVIIHKPKWEVEDEKLDNEMESWKKNLNPTSHIKNPPSHISRLTSINIGLLNCGAKRNIIRSLVSRGVTVYELPWDYDPFAHQVAHPTPGVEPGSHQDRTPRVSKPAQIPKIDGLVISNGPGDPKLAKASISIIKKALEKKIPTFGICLGNQLLALAAGGNTYKLKFGHRAQNQPTIDVTSKRCYITTQNHGFAVNEKKLPQGFKRWFYNANDNTNEGLTHENLQFFSVQFHPEATPGPTDTDWLFDYFLKQFR